MHCKTISLFNKLITTAFDVFQKSDDYRSDNHAGADKPAAI